MQWGSIRKYVTEDAADGGGRLFWSAADLIGCPVKADRPPLLREEELHERLEVENDFRAEEFDLGDAEQRARYVSIMDRVVNGWYVTHFVDRWRDPNTGRRMVYVEWSQRYGVIAPTRAQQQFGSSIARVG